MRLSFIFMLIDLLILLAYPVVYIMHKMSRFFKFKR